jgi:hypothetical protein
MEKIKLTQSQLDALDLPLERGLFLDGLAGSGKTTVALRHLRKLLERHPHDSMLIWVPQRTLASRYFDVLHGAEGPGSGQVSILTLGGLSRRMVELFWPMVAEKAGFGRPDQPPRFLTLETAQFYMAEQVRPLLEAGFFNTITIEPHRLYSQILDNLNKAAVVGFDYQEIGSRLSAAWVGEEYQLRVYAEAQECANRFREACLQNNLLDFSLQVDLFMHHLWQNDACRGYLAARYHHMIADNIEEDTPVAHRILDGLSASTQSHLMVYDQGGGYRRFLGADPERAWELRNVCQQHFSLTQPIFPNPGLQSFAQQIASRLDDQPENAPEPKGLADSVQISYQRYQPQLLVWIADEVRRLVDQEGIDPDQIVVLAPFLSDTLRFSLRYAFEQRGIPTRSHRPSRPLRDEPAVRSMMTLMCLAHPDWPHALKSADIAHMLMNVIVDMDAVRAALMSEVLYRPKRKEFPLLPFAQLGREMKERLTFGLGERYDQLLAWLQTYRQSEALPPDHFMSRLFGQVLAQPGFGFHADLDGGQAAVSLIESINKFRQVVDPEGTMPPSQLGPSYLRLVEEGLVAAQYLHRWGEVDESAVLLAPAYTYLVSNRMVDVQFWLNVGGRGWWERLYQPLTHPYVLSSQWPQGRPWLDQNEERARQQALLTLAGGLLHRCRQRVYLGLSDLGESGYEQQGPLLKIIHRIMLEHAELGLQDDL